MAQKKVHEAVLLQEVMSLLGPRHAKLFLDLTLGAAGHAKALLADAPEDARLVGLDRDKQILPHAEKVLEGYEDRIHLAHSPYEGFASVLADAGVGAVDCILADLGVSSLQLDQAERGFSFRGDGPLDMRMDSSRGSSARDLLETLSEDELARILHEYGEEPASRRIARRLVELRRRRVPRTTGELARFIESLRPTKVTGRSQIHPATKVFQALRIAVNDELGTLQRTLPRLLQVLAPNGRIAVISFHSLEDRIVKQAFRAAVQSGHFESLTKRPLEASDEERSNNPRSRSARLRGLRRKGADDV